MKEHTVSNPKRERGQSLVEFAFSLVILLILVAGIFDGSRALFTYLSMRDAAQEGALYASIKPGNDDDITDRVCAASNLVSDLCGDDDFDITIEFLPDGERCMNTSGTANSVRVTVQHQAFPITMPFIGVFVGDTVEITASILDTVITPTCD